MELDFINKMQEIAKKTVENISEEISKNNSNLSQTEVELAQCSIDRIEENKVVLENRKDGSKIDLDIEKLPNTIKEGDIIKKINGKYVLDTAKTLSESERIKNKMDDLWN